MKHILTAAALLLAAGCQNSPDYDPFIKDPDKDNPRQDITLTTKQAAYVDKGNGFAYDLLTRTDASTEKDYIISPLSLQFLLGMCLDGARNNTAEGIANTLGYGKDEAEEVDRYCRAMLDQLPSLDKTITLSIADAIVVNSGYTLSEDYRKRVTDYYDAEVSSMDFNDGEAVAEAINKWCSDHTNGLIPKILDKADKDILSYLMNAIYFKGQWRSKFQKEATEEEKFTTLDGSSSKVRMMKQTGKFLYGEDDFYSAVRLPYGNGAFSMTVVLPKKGHTVPEVAARLKEQGGVSVFDSWGTEVDLWLPTFETKFHIKLNDILSAMGMADSFDLKKADFTAMSPDALYLDFVQQHAIIKVDEQGSEAAAISSAGMVGVTSVGPEPQVKVFHADHPFLYLITEQSTGAILFAGRFANVKED